jgi:RimJ/RimL family protein N-acetyltransferase
VNHHRISESRFLQQRGFRFIELNYRPELRLEGERLTPDPALHFARASDADRRELTDLAGSVFCDGRIHLDADLGPQLGDARYRAWMQNAFELPHQAVVKCVLEERIAAFFVVENPVEAHSYWSLVGLRPELQGQGLGKRIWRGMLSWQHQQGVQQVSTSISSLNNAVLNLYARLGFRFPMPDMTFHWHVK